MINLSWWILLHEIKGQQWDYSKYLPNHLFFQGTLILMKMWEFISPSTHYLSFCLCIWPLRKISGFVTDTNCCKIFSLKFILVVTNSQTQFWDLYHLSSAGVPFAFYMNGILSVFNILRIVLEFTSQMEATWDVDSVYNYFRNCERLSSEYDGLPQFVLHRHFLYSWIFSFLLDYIHDDQVVLHWKYLISLFFRLRTILIFIERIGSLHKIWREFHKSNLQY